jgi:DNA modification methylase
MQLVEVPAFVAPAKFVHVVNGDIWQLGRHRLACGDATDSALVRRLLGSTRPRLMVTDPPYGVGYDPAWRTRELKDGNGPVRRALLNDDRADWRDAWALFPGDIVYCWHGALKTSAVQAGLEAADFRVRAQIVWDKGRLIISRGHYHWMHEACWYAVRRLKTANWQGDRKQVTIWRIPHKRRSADTGHATQKPIECMRRPILNHTLQGDVVYDPFLGSGTTLIAAEITGRACYAIELSPDYVALAIARWEQLTGRQAERLPS